MDDFLHFTESIYIRLYCDAMLAWFMICAECNFKVENECFQRIVSCYDEMQRSSVIQKKQRKTEEHKNTPTEGSGFPKRTLSTFSYIITCNHLKIFVLVLFFRFFLKSKITRKHDFLTPPNMMFSIEKSKKSKRKSKLFNRKK